MGGPGTDGGKEVIHNKADALTYYMLYGNDEHPFKACYTMMQIRTLLARAKFNVRSDRRSNLRR